MHQRCLSRVANKPLRLHGPVRTHNTQAAASQSTPKPRPDPFALLAPQLAELRTSLLSMLGSGHPAISEIAKYYFRHPSKQVRPVIVLLLAQATNGLGAGWSQKLSEAQCNGAGASAGDLDTPLTRPDVLNDWNPSMPLDTAAFTSTFALRPTHTHRHPKPLQGPATRLSPRKSALVGTVLPAQTRLAQIVEMMHTASLLHDDVIDASALRRGAPSAPTVFGNKLSVLGGDFVLGRASAALARLGDAEATALISSVLSNLVEGEILQLREVKMGPSTSTSTSTSTTKRLAGDVDALLEGSPLRGRGGPTSRDAWNIYLQKTYLKTASLMAKGARAAVVLGGCREGEAWKEIAYAYGRNLGIAFQLVDDVLDYESAAPALGKPGGADLLLGLATGPALYAWEEHPEMGALIARKFERPGDVDLARDCVLRSSGVQRTRALAQAYADKAKEVLHALPASEAKTALEMLTERVIGRKS